MSDVPSSVLVCCRCDHLCTSGGGSVEAVRFDGGAPEAGAPRLCDGCHGKAVAMLAEFLIPGAAAAGGTQNG